MRLRYSGGVLEELKPVKSGKVKVDDVNLYYELYGAGRSARACRRHRHQPGALARLAGAGVRQALSSLDLRSSRFGPERQAGHALHDAAVRQRLRRFDGRARHQKSAHDGPFDGRARVPMDRVGLSGKSAQPGAFRAGLGKIQRHARRLSARRADGRGFGNDREGLRKISERSLGPGFHVQRQFRQGAPGDRKKISGADRRRSAAVKMLPAPRGGAPMPRNDPSDPQDQSADSGHRRQQGHSRGRHRQPRRVGQGARRKNSRRRAGSRSKADGMAICARCRKKAIRRFWISCGATRSTEKNHVQQT